jgi:hypothetical protein
MNKNDGKYFGIVVDTKILSDKDNLDDDYSCSFKTVEKFPKIANVVNESLDELQLETHVPTETIQYIVDNNKIENNNIQESNTLLKESLKNRKLKKSTHEKKLEIGENMKFDSTFFESILRESMCDIKPQDITESINFDITDDKITNDNCKLIAYNIHTNKDNNTLAYNPKNNPDKAIIIMLDYP